MIIMIILSVIYHSGIVHLFFNCFFGIQEERNSEKEEADSWTEHFLSNIIHLALKYILDRKVILHFRFFNSKCLIGGLVRQ